MSQKIEQFQEMQNFAQPVFYKSDVSLAWQGRCHEESPSLKTWTRAAKTLMTEVKKEEEEEPLVLAGPSKARLFLSSRKQVKEPPKQNRVSFKPKCLRFVADVREWNARLECIYLNTSVCGEPSRVEFSEHIDGNLFDFFYNQTY